MSTSTNTQYGPTDSTKKVAIVPSTSCYLIKSDLENTAKSIKNNINTLFERLLDKYDKQDSKMDKQDETLESINAHIANHYANIDNKIETQLQLMSLQIT